MESDSYSTASTDTGPLESPSARLSTFSRRSRLAVQSAVLGRPVTLIHIVHLSVCVMDLTALYVSLFQTSNPVNLSSLAFVGNFFLNACVCFEMQMILEISSSE